MNSVYAVIMSKGDGDGVHTLIVCADSHEKAHQFILNHFQGYVGDYDNCYIFNSSHNIYSVVTVDGGVVEWYPGNVYFTIARKDLL